MACILILLFFSSCFVFKAKRVEWLGVFARKLASARALAPKMTNSLNGKIIFIHFCCYAGIGRAVFCLAFVSSFSHQGLFHGIKIFISLNSRRFTTNWDIESYSSAKKILCSSFFFGWRKGRDKFAFNFQHFCANKCTEMWKNSIQRRGIELKVGKSGHIKRSIIFWNGKWCNRECTYFCLAYFVLTVSSYWIIPNSAECRANQLAFFFSSLVFLLLYESNGNCDVRYFTASWATKCVVPRRTREEEKKQM